MHEYCLDDEFYFYGRRIPLASVIIQLTRGVCRFVKILTLRNTVNRLVKASRALQGKEHLLLSSQTSRRALIASFLYSSSNFRREVRSAVNVCDV